MKERIARQGDESLYQPKILSKRIRALYMLKQETGLPLTVMLDRALDIYISKVQSELEAQKSQVIDQK